MTKYDRRFNFEGIMIITSMSNLAGEQGFARILLVGDAPYYARFGFERLTGVIMPPPTNPDRVLGLALQAGAWDGITGEVTRIPQKG